MTQTLSKILIVDDEKHLLKTLRDSLTLEGFQVFTAASGREALRLLELQEVDVVLTDVRMPGMSGFQLLKQVKQRWPHTHVVIMTGYGSIQSAVESIHQGAANYILKPIHVDDLVRNIRELLGTSAEGNHPFREEDVALHIGNVVIVGRSSPVKRVIRTIQKVAATDLPVLILGESGTGKELAAGAIHYVSSRAEHAFLKLNCAAMPENLLESELFGYEAGAFTDARKPKAGKLELARNGTLFLDEIGDMPYAMQAKLLRVLETGEFERLGGTKTQRSDFRIVAATNQNLFEKIKEGLFREDLFYRLNAITIELPPLRQIKSDIPLLVRHFLHEYCQRYHLPEPRVSEAALRLLENHTWPGNVRELRNVIQRAVVLSDGKTIQPFDLPQHFRAESEAKKLDFDLNDHIPSLEELERDHIRRILQITGGNRNRAAAILHIHRYTLYRKLRKYNLE